MFNGRRQPSRGGTSRMTRECQVRFCEGLGVNSPGLLGNSVEIAALAARQCPSSCGSRRGFRLLDLTKLAFRHGASWSRLVPAFEYYDGPRLGA